MVDTINMMPGATLFPQTINITGPIALGSSVVSALPCTSALTGVPYHSAIATQSGSGTVSCVIVGLGSLVGNASTTAHLTWDNGDTSTVALALAAAPGPVPVVTGTVTEGALQGSAVTLTGVPTGLTGNCLLSPVTSLTITGVMVFTRL
jgi:hypothetical protein